MDSYSAVRAAIIEEDEEEEEEDEEVVDNGDPYTKFQRSSMVKEHFPLGSRGSGAITATPTTSATSILPASPQPRCCCCCCRISCGCCCIPFSVMTKA